MADTEAPGQRPPGRPSKLTPERHAAIVGAVRKGASRRGAADAARVASSTVYLWVAKAESDEGEATEEQRALALDLLEAEGAHELRLVEAIEASATDKTIDPKPLQFLLERRHAARGWMPRQKQELSGPNDGPIAVQEHGVVLLPALVPLEATSL